MSYVNPISTFTGDGSTTQFQYDWSILEGIVASTELCRVEVAVAPEGDLEWTTLTVDVDYTLNLSTSTITFISAPADGTIIRIQRFTDRARDPHFNYQSGSTIIETTLDADENRGTQVDQELEAQIFDCLRKTPAGDAWNAQGLEGRNAAPATHNNSWVTYAQMLAVIQGGLTIDTTTGDVKVYTGDGSTVDFAITGYRDLDALQLVVMVEAVVQSVDPANPDYQVLIEDDSGYPGAPGGPAYVRFATAPPDGSKIEIRIFKGVVVGFIADGSLDGDELADDSIGLRHLNIGAGVDLRVLVFDTDGDPAGRVLVHTDISDFDAGVRTNSLNQMATAAANVSMGLNQITQLSAGTGAFHAVNKSQMEAYIDGRLLAEQQSVEDDLPTSVSGSFTDIATFAFVPDEVTLTARFNGTHDATYMASFFGGNQRRVAGEQYADGTKAPDVMFERDSETIGVRLLALGNLSAWTQGRALARKYGDA